MFLIGLRRREEAPHDGFPFTLPLLAALDELNFTSPVTFLVGENGAGKSTLLEGIAAGMRATSVGRHDLARDPTLTAARRFANAFLFTRRRHAKIRLFLRAEDVFGFTGRVADDMTGLESEAREIESSMAPGYGRDLALGVVRGQRAAFANSYGENPDGQSHGETFLALLRRRLVPGGLYFLDEPETPLSPSRVLALMAMIAQGVETGSQFIIATHSPILLAQPGAQILQITGASIAPAQWGDLEHVRVTRAFLNAPASVLARVLDQEK
jgi:predicted ATPase